MEEEQKNKFDFEDDYIGRREFCENLVNLIKTTNAERAWSIGLNGSWGSGKTVVLNYLEQLLEDEDVFFIKYNAWENDFYKDPLIAMISSIVDYIEDNRTLGQKFGKLLDSANETLKRSIFELCKVAGGKLLDAVTELHPFTKTGKEIVKKVVGKAGEVKQEKEKKLTKTEDYKSYKDLIKEVQVAIREIARHKKLVFVVDELDRCLPEYAIEVLERLHHIFGLENQETKNLIVLLAVDKDQLDETIKQIYGVRVNKDKYLEKFIDLQIDLPTDKENVFEKKYYLEKIYIKLNDDLKNEKFIDECMNIFFKDYTIRQKEKILHNSLFILENIDNKKLNIYMYLAILFLLIIKNKNDIIYSLIKDEIDKKNVITFSNIASWSGARTFENGFYKSFISYVHKKQQSRKNNWDEIEVTTNDKNYYYLMYAFNVLVEIPIIQLGIKIEDRTLDRETYDKMIYYIKNNFKEAISLINLL